MGFRGSRVQVPAVIARSGAFRSSRIMARSGDLRLPDPERSSTVQWCHGPPGVALARALLSRYIDDGGLRDDTRAAVELTAAGQEISDCLCHGSIGNSECCAIAADIFDDDAMRRVADQKLRRAWSAARARGWWRTKILKIDVHAHGLFNGAAGVGYGLLRASSPSVVPSVLFLEGPRMNDRELRGVTGTRMHRTTRLPDSLARA
jgi:lantibiotic modifying enzyme